jgi:hypothetical protein
VKRVRFEPLPVAERFLLAYTDWNPPHRISRPWEPRIGEAEEKRLTRQWVTASQRFPQPTSLVAVPRGCCVTAEVILDEDERQRDRQAGMQAVANGNRETLAKPADERDRYGWLVLVELGQQLGRPLASFDIGESGIGRLDRMAVQAVRLVLPTAAELRQHVIDHAVERSA